MSLCIYFKQSVAYSVPNLLFRWRKLGEDLPKRDGVRREKMKGGGAYVVVAIQWCGVVEGR